MTKKNYKGRCTKRTLEKCKGVCRTYSEIGDAYVLLLESNDEIVEIRCNVPLEGLEQGEYTTDFVCVKKNGDLLVRECVQKKFLLKPMTTKLLDASRLYWLRRGVTDWGIVVEKGGEQNED